MESIIRSRSKRSVTVSVVKVKGPGWDQSYNVSVTNESCCQFTTVNMVVT